MSRSKRAPIWTEGYDGSTRKRRKRRANKRVRTADIADGAAYKKVSNSWNICDFKFYDKKNPKAGRK
jgi:hypothetical protein